MFSVCVVFVVPNAPHEQDRIAEAQTFQRIHPQRWDGRAAERCLDANSQCSVGWCWSVCFKMHPEHGVGRAAEPCLDGSRTVLG